MDTLEARSGEQLRQDYLDRARELQPMLRADSDEIERRREVTPEVVDAMIERGIFKMLLPRSIGGSELDPLTYTAVLELLGQADGSTAWCLGQNSGCSMIAPYLARSEEHTSELQSRPHLVCRLLLEKKNNTIPHSVEHSVEIPVEIMDIVPNSDCPPLYSAPLDHVSLHTHISHQHLE